MKSILLFVLCLVVACAFAREGLSDDNAVDRIVAVGDIHGDLPQLLAILQLADLVDSEGKWIAHKKQTFVKEDGSVGRYKSVTLVQMGDMLDRGPDDKAVMDYIIKLRREVSELNEQALTRLEALTDSPSESPSIFKCEVVNLLGNHELMNMLSQYHYVHQDSHEDFGGKQNRKRAFDVQGDYGRWLRSLPIAHVEGSSLFVHAGLSPSLARHGISKLNEEAWRLLHDVKMTSQDLHNSPIFSVHGPLWTRRLIMDAMNGQCDAVHETLRTLSLQRMVVGHTPQRSGRVETYCDDSLIAVDVGISKWMYGKLAALEITESSNGDVELREIVAKPVSKSAEPADVEAATTIDGLENAAMKDPTFLSEILESLQEARNKKPVEDDDL